jgi:hypothetical protein
VYDGPLAIDSPQILQAAPEGRGEEQGGTP